MELIWAELHGYKRFEAPAKINLEGRLVALIGQNEAGKSSFLSAIAHIESDQPFVNVGGVRELTRGVDIPYDQEIITAGFLLSDDDRVALSAIEGGEKSQWLEVVKFADGQRWNRIRPSLTRNLTLRKNVVELLETLLPPEGSVSLALDQDQNLTDIVKKIVTILNVQEQTLPKEKLETLTQLVGTLSADLNPVVNGSNVGLREMLEKQIEYESSPHPRDLAAEIIEKRIPRFLSFSTPDRELRDTYDLNANPTPKALANISRLADLDLEDLRAAITRQDQGEIETIIQRANNKLEHIFERIWSQSGVFVHLRYESNTMYVQVGNTGAAYNSIAERSDGLRHFVALIAFVTLNRSIEQKPILLIDEAESHLHYDAQADLMQMLAKQNIAAKIIYTTHSAGCLPEDLGTGVRLIRPIQDRPDRSEIQNWFWDSDSIGFSSLLFGLGASTLAFIPVRRALFAEGPGDFILLPSLLKDATNRASLGYQVVPGLSTISEEEVPLIRSSGSRVAFLVDGDEGGRKIAAKLRRRGVPNERILTLSDDANIEHVLEDFVDPKLYCDVVNELLSRKYGEKAKISVRDITEENRPKHLESRFKAMGLHPLSKREVAYQLLEICGNKRISYVKRRNILIALDSMVANLLGLDPQDRSSTHVTENRRAHKDSVHNEN